MVVKQCRSFYQHLVKAPAGETIAVRTWRLCPRSLKKLRMLLCSVRDVTAVQVLAICRALPKSAGGFDATGLFDRLYAETV